MPDDTVLRAFTDFVVSFDTRLRNPRWVLEHIDRRKGRGEANRCASTQAAAVPCAYHTHIRAPRSNSDFYHDREADPRLISRNEHYRGSGYDRGHMVRSCRRPTFPISFFTTPSSTQPLFRLLLATTSTASNPWTKPLACSTCRPRWARASTGTHTTSSQRLGVHSAACHDVCHTAITGPVLRGLSRTSRITTRTFLW